MVQAQRTEPRKQLLQSSLAATAAFECAIEILRRRQAFACKTRKSKCTTNEINKADYSNN
jgi:hypothetical protein